MCPKAIALFRFVFILVLASGLACSKKITEPEIPGTFGLLSVNVGLKMLTLNGENTGLPTDAQIMVRFVVETDTVTARQSIALLDANRSPVACKMSFLDRGATVSLLPLKPLAENTTYTLFVSNALKGKKKESFKEVSVTFKTFLAELKLLSLSVGKLDWRAGTPVSGAAVDAVIKMVFTDAVNLAELQAKVSLWQGTDRREIQWAASSPDSKSWTAKPMSKMKGLAKYRLLIDKTLVSESGRSFVGFDGLFYTAPDPSPCFPIITDDELLTLVQRQTFKYFWDFGHPASGMARERDTSGDVVTSGGSGFGIMAIVVGMERGFVSRGEGLERIEKIIGFLEKADRFHGAWPHWLNGSTGKVLPFSAKDDGGDLVETSFLVAGLLTVRQYLDKNIDSENNIILRINKLVDAVEWNWYTKGDDVLYWHWSPKYNWDMGLKIKGYNEALITYVLAASSSTFPIQAKVYHRGWAENGDIRNGKSFYGIKLPLGNDYGGPLFFAHYSFLGLNPAGLTDQYADYWEQNVNHSLINRAYCMANPRGYVGYGANGWGLTACDNTTGYSAHSPTNDLGIISPTAAISSIPFTPDESMQALRFFYYTIGDRLWGEYGFYDAIGFNDGWVASSTLAIDQGPQIVMIENFRSGLIWRLFMSCPEIHYGLNKLGFIFKS